MEAHRSESFTKQVNREKKWSLRPAKSSDTSWHLPGTLPYFFFLLFPCSHPSSLLHSSHTASFFFFPGPCSSILSTFSFSLSILSSGVYQLNCYSFRPAFWLPQASSASCMRCSSSEPSRSCVCSHVIVYNHFIKSLHVYQTINPTRNGLSIDTPHSTQWPPHSRASNVCCLNNLSGLSSLEYSLTKEAYQRHSTGTPTCWGRAH